MGASGSLPLAGVEAIVEGISNFERDTKKMGSLLDGLKPRSTMLQRAFSGAWEMVKGFGREVLNVAEYALGHLLADAVEWVVGKFKELISATIEAGSEFQTLELRLERLNFNTLVEGGMDYVRAGKLAVKMTKDQLNWLQKLAATTPYDNTDISNVYTLARSYGFADQNARGLTEDITNFAAGMGLGNTEIERIIVNFGQMVQQGKVTQREMNDLARGSFVPVNDILDRMKTNLKMNDKQLTAFRKTAASVPAFMEAFSQVVDERFSGAAERMAKTLKAAADNAMDLVKSIGGLHIVKPILDVIGARLSAFTSAFTDNPQRWDRLVNAAKRIGEGIAKIVNAMFGLLPSSESIADSAVKAVEGIADWIDQHGPGIVQFFKDLGEIIGGVGDKVKKTFFPEQPQVSKKGTGKIGRMDELSAGPAQPTPMNVQPEWTGLLDTARKIADIINNTVIPALVAFSDWVTENRPLIDEFWSTLGEIVGDVFEQLTGTKIEGGGFLDAVKQFMQYVIDNKEEIAKWVAIILKVIIVWQILATVWSIVLGILIPIVAAILSVVGVISLLVTIGGLLIPLFQGMAIGVALFVAALMTVSQIALAVIASWLLLRNHAELLRRMVATVLEAIKKNWQDFKNNMKKTADEIVTAWKNRDWGALGKAIIDGLIRGIKQNAGNVLQLMKDLAAQALQTAMDAFQIKSPSKKFAWIGRMTMEGFAQGVEQFSGLAYSAVANAMANTMTPAMASTNNYQTTNNLNLNIHTSASKEPIVQDFNTLMSMV